MINLKRIRENPDEVKQSLTSRNHSIDILDQLIEADKTWRTHQQERDQLKNQQKNLTPKGKPTSEELETLSKLSAQIKTIDSLASEAESKTHNLALLIPNPPLPDVPIGSDETQNKEIKTVGTPPTFSFTPKPHHELAIQNKLINFEAAAKGAGSRFALYTGLGAKLERALINFMLETHGQAHGYTEIMPPAIVNSKSLTGTGQLPKFAEDLFKLEETDYWLSPTSEVQLTNLYADSIIDESELPIKLTGYTPCFRKEAGSYGKDMSGIIRLHQFNKVELVKIVKPENAEAEHQQLLKDAETILQHLELPYRVVQLCTGDLGFSSAKTYDIEVWLPSQNKYREISSCSNFLDFQARRAMIRYKGCADKAVQYAYTLNGSGLAVGRTVAAILENFQNADGSIHLPKALEPYLKERRIG